MRYRSTLVVALLALFGLMACDDGSSPTQVTEVSPETAVSADHVQGMNLHQEAPRVAGRTIQNLDVGGLLEGGLGDAGTFTGRVVNLTFEQVGNQILASGRLIGQLTNTETGVTQRINQVFEGLELPIVDGLGNPIVPDGSGVCPILFLELGPIFLDVLGLVVEVPDPIVVEIRAERGPGQLLGNLLCGLLGILD